MTCAFVVFGVKYAGFPPKSLSQKNETLREMACLIHFKGEKGDLTCFSETVKMSAKTIGFCPMKKLALLLVF